MRRTPVCLTVALVFLLTATLAFARQLPVLPAGAFEGLPPAVRTELERAYATARAAPRDASAAGRFAMLLHAHEQLELAHAWYGAARQLDPSSLAWMYLSGVVLAELGDHAAAAAAFDAARRRDSEFLPAWLRLAESLMKAGDFERSRAQYRGLIDRFPELALAHYGLGQVLVSQGDRRGAIEHHGRAIELMPQLGPAHYALALAYRDVGREEDAQTHLDAYRKYGSARPAVADRFLEVVRAMKGTARDLIAEAARLGRAGRLEESVRMHERALEADPTAAQAHVNLISLYGRTGQPDKAAAHYQSALRLGANLADAHYNYGVLLAGQGRHADALDVFRSAVEVNPFHAQAHNNLAAMLARQGKLDQAVTHYRQTIANDPQHRAARFNLGRVLTALGRYAEAIEQLQKVLRPEDAETPRYMFALAEAYHRAGELDKARQYAEQARSGAEKMGQTDLAARITRVLAQLGKRPQ